jgi:hypothetical protein
MRSLAAVGGPGHLIGHSRDEPGPPEWTAIGVPRRRSAVSSFTMNSPPGDVKRGTTGDHVELSDLFRLHTALDCILRGGGGVAPPARGAPDEDAGCGLFEPPAVGLFAPVVVAAQGRQVTFAGDPALVPGGGVIQVAAGGVAAAPDFEAWLDTP